MLSYKAKTSSLPNQRGDVSPELAGALAKRAAQLKSSVQPSQTVEAKAAKQSDSDGGPAMIARLAAERKARVKANVKTMEAEKDEQNGKDKQSAGEMSEFEKAMAARKAKVDDQNADIRPNIQDRSSERDSGSQATETAASNDNRPLSDAVDVPLMVRDDSGTRLRALSDAASKRQIRQPQVRREGAAEQTSARTSEQVPFDLSAVLHAVPPADHSHRNGADVTHGVSTSIGQKDLPTNSLETVPVVVGNEMVDMDLDRVLELWGQDSALQETPQHEPTETVYLDSDQNDLVNGSSSWDDIQLPPPDFPSDRDDTSNWKDAATNSYSAKQLLRKISEEPSYWTESVTPPAGFDSGDVVEETFSVDDLPPPDYFGSHVPPPELIPGLSLLESELESMYPFAVPTPLLGNREKRDELPPPTEFDRDDGFVAPPPEGFDVPGSEEDNAVELPSGFEDFLPPPVLDETFPVDLSILPPPHLAESGDWGQEQPLTQTAFNRLPSHFNDNQEEVGCTLQTEVQLGFGNRDEPPPLPPCPPPSVEEMDNGMLDVPPPLPDSAPPDLLHDTNIMPIPEENELNWQTR